MAQRRALFLDRDGTLIRDVGYLADPAGVELLDGVIDGLTRAANLGYLLIVVSNQSGIGRGYYGQNELDAVDNELRRLMTLDGLSLAGSYYCHHDPATRCSCRKPSPGLILEAAKTHAIELERSWIVGDRRSDVEAGLAAGCHAAALGFEYADDVPTVSSLVELAERFL